MNNDTAASPVGELPGAMNDISPFISMDALLNVNPIALHTIAILECAPKSLGVKFGVMAMNNRSPIEWIAGSCGSLSSDQLRIEWSARRRPILSLVVAA